MNRIRQSEPNVPIDARAGVPARIGYDAMVHTNCNHVGRTVTEMWCQVVLKGDIPVRPRAQADTVDPNSAAAVDAIEADRNLPSTRRRRKGEILAVPTDPARQETRAAGVLGAVRPFDGPVVRKVHLPPGLIRQRRRLPLLHIAQVETPAVVEELPIPNLLSMAADGGQQKYSGAQDKGSESPALQAEAFESISLHLRSPVFT